MYETAKQNDSPLTITRLMVWTAGVAVSLTVAKLLNELSVDAWNRLVPYNPQSAGLDTPGYITAIVYGTCLSLFLIAARTQNFWKSPGKIILMIFAMICIIDWGLTVFACSMIIRHISVIEAPPPASGLGAVSDVSYVTVGGHVLGYYYENLPGEIGYWLGIPILLFALFRSQEESRLWKLAWFGFLCFTVMMLLEFTGWRAQLFKLPVSYRLFYFPIALGVPIIAMVVAYLNDLLKRHSIDWWTTLACTLLPIAWLAMVSLHLFNYFN
jgi:hypothetical protein